jgi:hypothetical protein
MRPFVATIVALALTVPAVAGAARIKPVTHGGDVSIRVAGKSSGYHRASAAHPIEIVVKGPTSIRILSRALIPPDVAAGPIAYALRVQTDGVAVQTRRVRAAVSTRATGPAGSKVGTLEREILRVAAGEHRIRISPEGAGDELAIRVLRGTGKKQKTTWISFAPEIYESAVRLHAGDAEETYYRLSATKPVEATIRGPLRMKVTSRIDFDAVNGTTQAYLLKVLLDGAEWKAFPLKARSSHTATYPDLPEITPGMGQVVDLQVPNGTHDVSFHLDGMTAAGGALRIRVPKPTLRLQPQ